MLGSRQTHLPTACEAADCGRLFGQYVGDRIYIPWLEAENGRALWYLHVCPRCWWEMSEPMRWRAVNPPRQRSAPQPEPEPEPEPVPEPEPEPVVIEPRIREDGVRSKRWGTSGPRRWHRGRVAEPQSA